jgi:hypothetical protein
MLVGVSAFYQSSLERIHRWRANGPIIHRQLKGEFCYKFAAGAATQDFSHNLKLQFAVGKGHRSDLS